MLTISNIIRFLKQLTYRFRYYLILIIAIYGLIIPLRGLIDYKFQRKGTDKYDNILVGGIINNERLNYNKMHKEETNLPVIKKGSEKSFRKLRKSKEKEENIERLNSTEYGIIMIENIVGEDPNEIHQRFLPPKNVGNDVKIIELDNRKTGISNANMDGCKEWNCIIRYQQSDMIISTADAILINRRKKEHYQHYHINKYYIFFTQESAANYPFNHSSFNLTLNFIRNSPVSSPYGYTVKLAKGSRPIGSLINDDIIRNKSIPIAWFVSNCKTASQREIYVKYLKKYLTVDIFGFCGNTSCVDNDSCENLLNYVYYFYLSFENSICEDYITEKLWKHGYGHEIIPIVLKRSIVERYAPPHSFIAVDDFKTIHDLADYLKYLMHNLTAYREYFEWRREYKVLFLNGNIHDDLERPWGFCQLCRLLWMNPRPKYVIENFTDFWHNSCELSGTLVNTILREELKNSQQFELNTKLQ